MRYIASATITRPNDTTAYTALDVVSTQAGAVLEFATLGKPNGVSLLTELRYMVDTGTVPSGMGAFRLHLYNAAPTAIADNAAFNLPAADRAKYVGFIEFGTPLDLGDTLFSQKEDLRKQVALSGGSLYGILQTVNGFTPTANRIKTITLLALDVTEE